VGYVRSDDADYQSHWQVKTIRIRNQDAQTQKKKGMVVGKERKILVQTNIRLQCNTARSGEIKRRKVTSTPYRGRKICQSRRIDPHVTETRANEGKKEISTTSQMNFSTKGGKELSMGARVERRGSRNSDNFQKGKGGWIGASKRSYGAILNPERESQTLRRTTTI